MLFQERCPFLLLLSISPHEMLHKRLALMIFSPRLDMVTQHILIGQQQEIKGETQPPSSVSAARVAEEG